MTTDGDYQHGRHVGSALRTHLVFVTNYRRGVLARTHREHLWSASYLAPSSGGAPPAIVNQHVQQQCMPGR
jgi:REP element-mobilizing transposase RayT